MARNASMPKAPKHWLTKKDCRGLRSPESLSPSVVCLYQYLVKETVSCTDGGFDDPDNDEGC